MITVKEISSLMPRSQSYYKMDSDRTRGLGSMGVRVLSTGRKQFVFIYRRSGKRIVITLGDFPVMSLADARDKTKALREYITDGKDPKTELQNEADKAKREIEALERRGTLQQLFEGYADWMERTEKRTAEVTLKSLKREIYPHIPKETKAAEVETRQVVLILANIIKRGAPVESNRVRTKLHAAFNYGLRHDNDPANLHSEFTFGLKVNPITAIPKQTDAEGVGNNFLELNEIQFVFENFLKASCVGIKSYLLLKLCFYSGGQRPNELCKVKKADINLSERVMLLPGGITKNKSDHLVPLTKTAVSIVEEAMAISGGPYLFPQQYDPYSPMTPGSFGHSIAYYRKEFPDAKTFTGRDIRRTCKTLMGKLRISKEIRDKIQNHAMKGDVSAKHYDRYDYMDEKIWALELWESHLNGAEIDNVVSIGIKKAL